MLVRFFKTGEERWFTIKKYCLESFWWSLICQIYEEAVIRSFAFLNSEEEYSRRNDTLGGKRLQTDEEYLLNTCPCLQNVLRINAFNLKEAW